MKKSKKRFIIRIGGLSLVLLVGVLVLLFSLKVFPVVPNKNNGNVYQETDTQILQKVSQKVTFKVTSKYNVKTADDLFIITNHNGEKIVTKYEKKGNDYTILSPSGGVIRKVEFII